MSLHQLAQQIQASGRGNDTQLVHMAPAEVRAMRKLAQQHGGDLTINPRTGLPEAGFLESILPTVVGAGVGIMTGNPMLGAAAGGAAGMAMNKGSIQSGLLAGLGAYGMGSLGAGLMETGAGVLGSNPETVAGALGVPGAATGPGSQAAMLAEQNAGMGAEGLNSVRSAAATAPGATPSAGPSTWDQLQAGYKGTKFDMDFLKKNMFPIGMAAAPLLMASSSSSNPTATGSTGNIRPSTYSQTYNPRYGEPGQPQLIQKYTAQEPVAASDWGSRPIYMADGGLAELASNSQYLGANPLYPMAQLDHTQYATSTQLPTSAAIRDADYDTPTAPYTGQEIVRMAEGGSTSDTGVTNMEKWLQAAQQVTPNPAYASMPLAPQAQQPSYPAYAPPPTIQPQMAAIQQHYAAPQRQAPEAFQYQAPTFAKYGIGSLGGSAGGGSGGVSDLIDPITKQPVNTAAQIIAANAAAKKPTTGSGAAYTLPGGSNPANTYTGPGINGDAASYYDRYPVADVYDYANNQPTRPDNPTSGSPEFNIPSNVPVDISSGMAGTQQDYANMGYTDYIPNATNVDGGAANGGLMPYGLRYAMGGGISNLGSYSDGGRLLKGPGDGVSDSIPAQIGRHQPARLADGEFVIPARIVSELGNGSTDAGAKRLYAMMDRVQQGRTKSVGKDKVAVDSKAYKHLPA